MIADDDSEGEDYDVEKCPHIVTTAGSVVTAVSQSHKNVWGTPIELGESETIIECNHFEFVSLGNEIEGLTPGDVGTLRHVTMFNCWIFFCGKSI